MGRIPPTSKRMIPPCAAFPLHPGAVYRRVLRRRALPLGLSALPALAARPSRLDKAVETLRYPSAGPADLPEPNCWRWRWRWVPGKERGANLVSELLQRLAMLAVRVVVGSHHEGPRRFYRAQGFSPVRETEVYAGQHSEVPVWYSSST